MRAVLPLLAVLLAAPSSVAAQDAPLDTLRGSVVTGDDSVPVPGRTVVLHRIGPDTGMAVDSARTDAGGRFAIPYRRRGDEVVLASTRHEGVLYFGPALHGPETGGRYRIRVYPTRSTGSDRGLSVARRTVVVSREGEGLQFMDAIDVAGDADTTLVGPGGPGGSTWWRLLLPSGVRDVRLLPGGVGAEAVEVGEEEVRLSAPVPATGQRVLLGYAATDGPVELSPERPIGRFEVVVRGDRPGVRVEGLGEGRSTRIGERTVRRYAARDLAASDTVRISLVSAGPGGAGGGSRAAWIAAAAGLVLAAGAALTWRWSA